jgi:hypothetical protein
VVRYGTVRYGTVLCGGEIQASTATNRRWTLDRYAFQCSSRIGNDTKPPGVMLVARHFGLCSKILETREDRMDARVTCVTMEETVT